MVERLRSALLPVTLAVAFMLAIAMILAADAGSKPGNPGKPAPGRG